MRRGLGALRGPGRAPERRRPDLRSIPYPLLVSSDCDPRAARRLNGERSIHVSHVIRPRENSGAPDALRCPRRRPWRSRALVFAGESARELLVELGELALQYGAPPQGLGDALLVHVIAEGWYSLPRKPNVLAIAFFAVGFCLSP